MIWVVPQEHWMRQMERFHWSMELFRGLAILSLMTVNHRFYVPMDGLSREKRIVKICISLDMDTITQRH